MVKAEAVGCLDHQPEKEEDEFNSILETESPRIPSKYIEFKNIHTTEGEREIHINDGGELHRVEEVTFGFPIVDIEENVQMNNINPPLLPHFHRLVSEYHDSFLFKFDIPCHNYDYTSDAKKLRLFPATLKDSTLYWFMGLGGDTIRTWEQMHRNFLKKYQDYYKARELREEIFKMTQKEEEILEDSFLKKFLYM
jgi:hypothetical protein